MSNARADERFDLLVSQVHDWVESAVALDEGHFPNELLSDLRDLIEELKSFLDEEDGSSYKKSDVMELFATPEVAEITTRFPKVRRALESAFGAGLMEMIEEQSGYDGFDDEDDDDL
jgi:hypothetical protein